jgi:hypothetical protein
VDLQTYCKQKLGDNSFGRIYVSKKAYEKELPKMEQKLHKKRKIAKIV